MGWLNEKLINMAMPLVIGPISMVLMQFLKGLSAKVDDAPSWAKQGIVVLISSVLTILGTVLGTQLCDPSAPCTLENVDSKALMGALIAVAMHHGRSLSDKSSGSAS